MRLRVMPLVMTIRSYPMGWFFRGCGRIWAKNASFSWISSL